MLILLCAESPAEVDSLIKLWKSKFNNSSSVMKNGVVLLAELNSHKLLLSVREPSVLFSIKSENLKLASRSRDYVRKKKT